MTPMRERLAGEYAQMPDADLFTAWNCHLSLYDSIKGNRGRLAVWTKRRDELAAEINGRTGGVIV